MKHRLLLAALGTGAIGLLAGCAAKTSAGDGAGSPDRNVVLGEGARWTANIQSVTQSRGDVVQTTRDKSYGSLTWTRGEAPSLTNANIVFTYTGNERFLSWAIITGSCGTPALPLIPMSNFPELNIGGGGRAQVTTSLPIEFPASGSFHVDIYRSRQQSVDQLVACGNLKLSPG